MIPVIWHAQEEGRGYYNVTAMLNDLFDRNACEHFGAWRRMPEEVDGGVVIVHGSREQGRLEKLNRDIQRLKWVLLIFVGDEENSFPAEEVHHPNMITWLQEPHPTRSVFAERLIINGWSHDFLSYIPDWGKEEKNLDWFFAGQVTHERRRACTNALAGIDWGGIIIETKGYCQGVSRREYASLMGRAKIVPCPSGPMAQDTARPWEALECGAIPILDDFTPQRREPGFWKMLLGNHPFPVITDWSTLPQVINDVKGDWEYHSKICQEWWRAYKRDFQINFISDVKALKEIACIET